MSYGFSISNQTNSNSKFKVLLAATRTIAIWIWLSVKKKVNGKLSISIVWMHMLFQINTDDLFHACRKNK